MKQYIRIERVQAEPMSLGDFIEETLIDPYDTDPKPHPVDEQGYFVKDEDGNSKWLPKSLFEKTHRETSKGVDFGYAIEALKAGYAIRRQGWNGKGLFVVKQIPAHIVGSVVFNMQSLPQTAKELIVKSKGFIDYTDQCLIYNESNGRADSWVPSISDVFATDWEIIK